MLIPKKKIKASKLSRNIAQLFNDRNKSCLHCFTLGNYRFRSSVGQSGILLRNPSGQLELSWTDLSSIRFTDLHQIRFSPGQLATHVNQLKLLSLEKIISFLRSLIDFVWNPKFYNKNKFFFLFLVLLTSGPTCWVSRKVA